MRGFVAAAIIFAALLASAAANVQDANMWRAHKIHADHRSRVSGECSLPTSTRQHLFVAGTCSANGWMPSGQSQEQPT
jgi:hypothetical protein